MSYFATTADDLAVAQRILAKGELGTPDYHAARALLAAFVEAAEHQQHLAALYRERAGDARQRAETATSQNERDVNLGLAAAWQAVSQELASCLKGDTGSA